MAAAVSVEDAALLAATTAAVVAASAKAAAAATSAAAVGPEWAQVATGVKAMLHGRCHN